MGRLHPISSEALRAVSYDRERRVLTVQFESGSIYEYFDVAPELHAELLEAQPHPWQVVGERVKAHRFRRIA
ncbi:KTSC domain-containing protein [Agromyces subbeticus]|uniref:KTSC domain-containing protein n=1 Tax=Agromyces subbeticus TaxID=293890 RepID=UPI0003B6FB91|nr:KTSC domain-containing protein [Agromyces subbeticus]